MYYNKYRILIPIQQNNLKKEYGIDTIIYERDVMLHQRQCKEKLIRASHAKELFSKLEQIPEMNITSSLWFVDNQFRWFVDTKYGVVYNGTTRKIEDLGKTRKARILKVLYLKGEPFIEGEQVNYVELSKYGLIISERSSIHKTEGNDKEVVNTNNDDNVDWDIQKLLDCDKKRCGLASYEREMLYDIKAGHWDVFENSDLCKMHDKGLIARE